MQERTFDCAQCGASVTIPVATGRPRKFCEECARLRKNLRAQADRANVRVVNTMCQRPGCGNPLPAAPRAVGVGFSGTQASLTRLSGRARASSAASRSITSTARPSSAPKPARTHGFAHRTPRGTTPRPRRGSHPRRARRPAAPTCRRTPASGRRGRGQTGPRILIGTRGTGSSGPPRTPRLWPRCTACGEPGCGRTRTVSGCPSGSGGASSIGLKAAVSTVASRPTSSTWITWCRWPRVDDMPQPTWWSLVGGATFESTPCF